MKQAKFYSFFLFLKELQVLASGCFSIQSSRRDLIAFARCPDWVKAKTLSDLFRL